MIVEAACHSCKFLFVVYGELKKTTLFITFCVDTVDQCLGSVLNKIHEHDNTNNQILGHLKFEYFFEKEPTILKVGIFNFEIKY